MSEKTRTKKSIGTKFIKFLLFVSYTLGIVLIILVLSPWKSWTGGYLEQTLSQQGLDNPKLTIDQITSTTLSLRDISAGGHALNIKNLEAYFTPEMLQAGRVRDVLLDGLHLSAVQTDEGWQIDGLNFKPSQGDAKGAAIPLNREALDQLPFETVIVTNSHADISGAGWSMGVPFSVTMHKDIEAAAQNINFKYGKTSVDIGDFSLSAALNGDDHGWSGTWSIKNLSVPAVTIMDAQGVFSFNGEVLSITGDAKATDVSKAKGSFAFKYDFDAPEKAALTLRKVSMPWGGGTILSNTINIPVFSKGKVRLPVYISKVSVNELMKVMTGEYVRATGTLSGSLPVIVARDGTVSLGSGELKTNQKGRLSMPPDVIPGQGKEIDMTRDILRNFQYEDLKVGVTQEGADNISVLLALKGNNPDMYNGRAVHLNVRLGGDVLDFIRSNVMMMTQPETLFTQEQQ